MDIPSLFMIPSAVSSGKVHSVFPNSTDADFDFNRDSDATRVNSEGLIERVGYYGSEQVVNGGFDTDSDWGLGATWSIANGKANYVNTSTTFISQSGMTITSGKQYKVSFTISNCTNTAHMTIYDRSAADLLINNENWVNGTYVRYFTASASEIGITIWGNASGSNFSLDNVSVVEVTGDRARLNYEIEGGLVNTKPSLLLEPQSTNLVTYSEDFSQSVWNTGTSRSYILTATNDINPTGLSSSYKFKGTAIDNQFAYIHYTTIGTTITNSIYVKRVSGTGEVKLRDVNNSNTDFNLSVADGWKRISVTAAATSTTARFYLNLATIGDEILIFGAQQEALSYPTSYIPTNGSTQTRAAETCNGAGTSSIFESTEGILYCEIKALANDGTNRYISLNDGTTSNRVNLFYDTNNVLRGFITGISSMPTTATITNFNKVALKYKSGNIALFVNGVEVATKTDSISLSGLNSLAFDQTGGLNFYGKIRDIRVYNTKEMTDSEVDILLTKITS